MMMGMENGEVEKGCRDGVAQEIDEEDNRGREL